MRNKLWRCILSGVSVVVFLLLAFGSTDTEEEAEKAVTSQAPEIRVSAHQLYADYEANEVATDQKYKGKVLEVLGTVDDIGKDIVDTIYVTLETGEFGSVQCYFVDEHRNKVAQLRNGQSIMVKGKCEGKMMNVLLKRCVIE